MLAFKAWITNITMHECTLYTFRHQSTTEYRYMYQVNALKIWTVFSMQQQLTHWCWVTHICIGKLITIGSDNGLSPGRRQAIIWTNDEVLLIRPLGTRFNEILIRNQTFSFMKMHLKMSSVKWRPFCIGLNVLSSNLCYNVTFSSSNLLWKCCKISFTQNLFLSYPIVLKFSSDHGSDTAMYNDWFKMIGQLRWTLWANEFSWNLIIYAFLILQHLCHLPSIWISF